MNVEELISLASAMKARLGEAEPADEVEEPGE